MANLYKFDSDGVDSLSTPESTIGALPFDENSLTSDDDQFEMDDDLALLDFASNLHSPYSSAEEFAYAPSHSFSQNSYKQEKISAESFPEGAPRIAFNILQKAIHSLLLGKIAADNEHLAYCFGKFEKVQPTFSVCCQMLEMRVDILRLRIQFEWWRRKTQLESEVKFCFCPVPQFIWQHATLLHHISSVAIVRQTWCQPGIDVQNLYAKVKELDGYDEATLANSLSLLKQQGIVSSHQDHLYVTGCNRLAHEPSMNSVRKRSVNWLMWFEAKD